MAAAAGLSQDSAAAVAFFDVSDGVKVVTSGHTLHVPVLTTTPPAIQAGTSVTADVTLPRDTRIQRALFEVIAEPVPNAVLSSVAAIRPAAALASGVSSAAIIDFGRIVTLGGVDVPASPRGPARAVDFTAWNGTGWAAHSVKAPFPEFATERLLVQSTSSSDTGDSLALSLAAGGGVTLPVVPASLELVVGGTTAWVERQGSSTLDLDSPSAAGDGGVRYVVDATDAVRTALQAALAAVPAGEVTIAVMLRAAMPGALRLTPQVNALRVYHHAFPPEGVARTFDQAEEGVVDIDVTPPDTALVYEVSSTVRGSFGTMRVVPAVGQDELTGARLVLAVGRSILVGLPRVLTGPFASLSAIRLRLGAGAGSGGQVTGRLLGTDAAGRPADPVKGGDVAPVTVTDADQRWYTLSFPAPVTLPRPATPSSGPAPAAGPAVPPSPADAGAEATVAAWVELQAGYGEIECGLTPDDPSAALPGGLVRRRASGRGISPLTTIAALGPVRAALRVAGKPDPAIAAVRLQVKGTAEALDLTPTSDSTSAVLTLSQPVPPPFVLQVTCAAAGSVTLDGVTVTYSEQEQP